jgi:ribonucleoside-triphosphate reductase
VARNRGAVHQLLERQGLIDDAEAKRITDAILNLEVMPSMRALMTAGKALDRDNVAGFNCSYIPIDHPRAFDEMMYILMCGTGVGFSVERQYVTKLPEVAEEMHPTETVVYVVDSKIGWAKAFRELVTLLVCWPSPNLGRIGCTARWRPLEDLWWPCLWP